MSIKCAQLNNADLRTLDDRQWLNDVVINFYLRQFINFYFIGLLLCHCYRFLRFVFDVKNEVPKIETFFYTKLRTQGAAQVMRWLPDMKSYRHLIIPLHLE